MSETFQASEAAPQSETTQSSPETPPLAEGQPQAPEKQITLWDKLTVKPAEVEAAAEAVAEEPKAEPAPAPEKKPRQARKLADLAEREAAAALSAAEKQELATYRKDIAELKVNPLAILAKAGVTYENVTLDALKGKAPKEPSPELIAVRAELQKEIDGIKTAEFNRQVGSLKREIRDHVDADPEKFKYIVGSQDYDKVWDTMVEIATQSGGKVAPTYSEAAEFYENKLKEQADKFMAINAKAAPPASAKVEAAEKTVSAPAKPAAKPALTNALGSPAVVSAPTKAKTKEDAFKAFKTLVDKAYRGEGLR